MNQADFLESTVWALQLRAIRTLSLLTVRTQASADHLARGVQLAAAMLGLGLAFLLATIGTIGLGAS
jgi:hypothetical protein